MAKAPISTSGPVIGTPAGDTSEELLHSIIDALPVAAYACDPEGLIASYNTLARELWGYAPPLLDPDSRFCGNYLPFDPGGETIQREQCPMALALRWQQRFSRLIRIDRPDGTHRLVNATAAPVRGKDGRLLGAISTLVDLTEQKKAEESAAEAANRFRAIFEATPDCVCVLGPNGILTSVNPAAVKLCAAKSADELIGQPLASHVAPGDRDACVAAISRAFTGEGVELRLQMLTLSGATRWLDTRLQPIRDDGGRIVAVLGLLRDSTAIHDTENALRRSQRHLVEAQAIAHVGSWEWNILDGANIWSDENYRLFGYEPGSVQPSHQQWVDSLHPEDRQRVLDFVQAALDGTEAYDIEYRVIHPGGQVRHVHCRGDVYRDGAGKAIRMAGTAMDITDRHRAEEKLQQKQAELARLDRIETLGQMATGLAHELNQPLSAIAQYAAGTIELLSRGEATRRSGRRCRRSSRRRSGRATSFAGCGHSSASSR
jgi:PAS domain S-box-containing protein